MNNLQACVDFDAADWFLRLQELDMSEQELLEWERWMAASASHRKAFAGVASAWRKSSELGMLPMPADDAIVSDCYDGQESIAGWCERQPKESEVLSTVTLRAKKEEPLSTASVRSMARRRWIPLAMAASVAAFVFVFDFLGQINLTPDPISVYETVASEHSEIELTDGSHVTLGANSSLSSGYSSELRQLVLARGEALFKVTPDAKRPFTVTVGHGSVTALGTAFNISRRADQVVVTVTEGKVEVRNQSRLVKTEAAPDPNSEETATLVAGEQITYNIDGGMGELITIDSGGATSWLEGYRRYRNEPLKLVVADVNRYTNKQIILVGPKTEKLLFTGTLFQDQVDEWLAGVTSVFSLEVVEVNDRQILLRATAGQLKGSR